MISVEIGETMIELSLAALEAMAGEGWEGRVDRRGEGGGGGGRERRKRGWGEKMGVMEWEKGGGGLRWVGVAVRWWWWGG